MKKNIFLIVIMTGLLAACTSTEEKQDTASVEDRSTASGTDGDTGSPARSYGSGDNDTRGMSPLDDPQSLLAARIIYFEYDQSTIQLQYREIIEAHALYLSNNPGVVMTLEGHADERGSREYNLALGERRSLAVKRQMTLLGAASAQIRTVSYGEERPVEAGHDDYSWSQNRRVELLY